MEKALPGEAGSSPALSAAEIEDGWTVEEEKKLRNRMDWHILPLVTALYLMCFLDRFVVSLPSSPKGRRAERYFAPSEQTLEMHEFRECKMTWRCKAFASTGL